MHQAILPRAARNAEVLAAARLRFIRSSSASLPPQVMAELEATFGCPVIESYGMTEAAHQMASNRLPPGLRKPGSVGAGRRTGGGGDGAGRAIAASRRDRRDRHSRSQCDGRLREEPGRQRHGLRAWLVPHRRPGRARRGWLSARHRPAQGDHQPRRREDLAARGRRRADGPSGGGAGRHLRHAARQARRGGRGGGRAARRHDRQRERHPQLCRDAARRLQGAAQGPDPGRDPQGRDGQAAAHRPRRQTRSCDDDADHHLRRRCDRRLSRRQACHRRPGRPVDRRARRASRRDPGERPAPDRGRPGIRRACQGRREGRRSSACRTMSCWR